MRISEKQLLRWRQEARSTKLEDLIDLTTPVVSPTALAAACSVRNEQCVTYGGCRKLAVDLHCFGLGVPPQRCSQVGGLPLWRDSKYWPVDSFGNPYRFFLAVDYSQSKDIVSLPDPQKDVLYVFLSGRMPRTDLPESLHFEWGTAAARSCVPFVWPSPPRPLEFHGFAAPFRTWDFFDQGPVVAETSKLAETTFSSQHQIPFQNSARFLGFKIGGLPCFQNGGSWDAWERSYGIRDGLLTYLGCFSTIAPSSGRRNPWLNRSAPYDSSDIWADELWLNWYDGFCIHFLCDPTGDIKWVLEFP